MEAADQVQQQHTNITTIREQQWIDNLRESVEAMTRTWYGEARWAYEQARQKSLSERGLAGSEATSDSSQSSAKEGNSTAALSTSSQRTSKSNEANEFIQSLSLQYGEMPLRTWMKLLFTWIPAEKLQQITSFCDLGSGNGRLLIQTSVLCPHFQQLHGYEILPSLHNLAKEAQAKLSSTTLSSTSTSSTTALPSSPAASSSERIHFHLADFTFDKSWVKLPGPCLYYICATAFSDSLLERLFSSFTQLPVGSIIVLISYPIPAKHNYSQSYRIIYSSEETSSTAEGLDNSSSDAAATLSSSSDRKAVMTWGESKVFIYEKVNQRKAENNILRSFIRK